MLKLAIVGGWCAAVCLASVYLTITYKPEPPPPEPQFPVLAEHHVVQSDVVSAPIIKKGEVEGYFIAQVSLTANDGAWHHRDYPWVELTDELITFLQNSALPTEPEFNLADFRKDVLVRMNKRMGSDVFYKVLVTKLDYLTQADLERMRDPVRSQMKVIPIVDKARLDVLPDSVGRGGGE